ncbi:MAG TPA: M48 family metallopeptidase [Candidatus Paceibacterota bacterium]
MVLVYHCYRIVHEDLMINISKLFSGILEASRSLSATSSDMPAYSVRVNARAKHIRISIGRKGECLVTIPKRGLRSSMLRQAEKFVESKKGWILEHSEKARRRAKAIEEQESLRAAASDTPPKKYSEKELRELTRTIVTERLAHFNMMYGYEYKDIRIKKMTSRWGSCSRKGNLNFSHKLALLSPEELDYVVVHELCHLGEFNHSANFWKLVERAVPDYKRISKGMKGRLL